MRTESRQKSKLRVGSRSHVPTVTCVAEKPTGGDSVWWVDMRGSFRTLPLVKLVGTWDERMRNIRELNAKQDECG